ncbi:MAG: hypothetical protein H7281_08200 [Bacteriovorax sp.]|nr:hypothetical protein [Bacteriovorax sp.]
MKIIIALTIFLSATALQASDKTYYFDSISQKFNDSGMNGNFDTTVFKSNVLYGRCFYPNSQRAFPSALAIYTSPVSSGPLGNPNDTVSYGLNLINFDKKADTWDYYTFAELLYSNPELKDKFKELFYDSNNYGVKIGDLVVRKNDDGNYYGAIISQNPPGYPNTISMACYFFGIH